MDFQELNNIWNRADESLETNLKINKAMFKEVSMQKIKSKLYELKLSSWIEIAFNIPFALFLILYVIDQFTVIKYSGPAFLLLLISLFSLTFSGHKLYLYYRRIHASQSLVETQKSIEKLKYYEQMEKNLLYVIIPLFSTAFLIVMSQSILNIDLYQYSNWVVLQTAASLIVALIIVFILKKFPNRKIQESLSFLKEINAIE
ncbi:hypothetical protein [uncultured Sunxiuqinia sp.]|uniref:hypothetical protein n=1 Tax=uncultured Sunxiuqinia sp. TaxID=1573825 RepID=UPI002AA6CDC6|nr:hypothetical protein [uncultured Sunxiuqinia sp.]